MSIKAFSQKSLRFDHLPDDSELVWLLGDRDCTETVDVTDTPELLAARPKLLPMRIFVGWLLVFGGLITAAPWWIPTIGIQTAENRELHAMILLYWLILFPIALAVFGFANRRFAMKGDYFRLDKQTRRLDLCQHGRVVGADELVAFTLLTRYEPRKGWVMTQQIDALVRASDGAIEHFPIFREGQARELAYRLATFFGLNVRGVLLGLDKSQALKDF